MARPRIEEGTQHPVRIALLDGDDLATTPSTLRYRLDCETTGDELVDWTVLTPATSVDVTIPATANEIINDANEIETKRVTVQANYGTALQIVTRYVYDVLNNRSYE